MSTNDPGRRPEETPQGVIYDDPQSLDQVVLQWVWGVVKSKWLRAALILAVLGAGAYGVRKYQIHRRYVGYRARGLAAMQAGDPVVAVDLLGRYLARFPDDADALVAYCAVRPKVPDTDGRNAIDTIQALRRLLAISPNHFDQRRELMRRLLAVDAYGDAGAEAEPLLGRFPRDSEALGVRTRCLIAQGRVERNRVAAQARLDRAIETAGRWRDVSGFNLETERDIIDLMAYCKVPAVDIIKRCETQLAGNEADPRYCVLSAYGYEVAGNNSLSTQDELLTRASQAFSADDKSARDDVLAALLARQLDDRERFDEALAVLTRWSALSNEPTAAAALGMRLFIAGRWDESCDAFARAGMARRVDELAIIALCATRAGRTPQAAAARTALSNAHGETAAPWNAMVDFALAPRHTTADAMCLLDATRKVAKSSIGRNRESAAVWWYYKGEAELVLGEQDLALEAWRYAVSYSRAWTDPIVRAVPILSELGRWSQAMEMADMANRRAPRALAVASIYAQICASLLERSGPGVYTGPDPSRNPQKLLELADAILKQAPDNEAVLCVRIGVLARQESTKSQAKTALDAAIHRTPALSNSALSRLAAISESTALGREEACLDAAEKAHGATAQLSLARSMILARHGRIQDARLELDSDVAKYGQERGSADSAGAVEWEIARAMFLDQVHDPGASAAVAALSDHHPDSLTAQRTALRSMVAGKDPALLTRIVERVRHLTGDHGLEGQIARARMLLSGTPASTASLQEAKHLLDDAVKSARQCVDAHALLATYYEATFDPEQARSEWATAAGLAPGAPQIVLAYARTLREKDDAPAAVKALEWLAAQPPAGPVERAQLARILADCGKLNRAIEILELPSAPSLAEPVDLSLLLEQLYRRAGRTEDADRLAAKTTASPTLGSIVHRADRMAAQGKEKEARALLDTLASLHLADGTAELAIAEHVLRFKGSEAAMPAFEEACRASPRNAAAWKQLIVCCMEAGHADKATAAATAGSAAIVSDPALSELHAHPDLISLVVSQPELRSFASLLVENPAKDSPTVRAIRTTQDKNSAAENLAALADQFPALLPLQRLSFFRDVAAKRLYHAGGVASRTVRVFPTLPEPCGWLFAADAAMEDWRSALNASKQWRDRCAVAAPSQTLDAEFAIAECQVKTDRIAEAVQTLEAHRDRALANPRANARWLQMYVVACEALPEKKGPAKLRDRLAPLLQSPAGREAWIGIGPSLPDAAEASAWMTMASDAIPPEDAPARLALAGGWLRLAARRPGPECYDRACAALAPLLAGANPSPSAMLSMAALSQQEGDIAAAEAGYRKVLALSGGDDVATVRAMAANNLAELIIRRRVSFKDLDEALALANSAVAARRDSPSFRDTLGAVYSKRKQHALAVAELREASRLAPSALRYRVRLAQALFDSGDVAAAHVIARELTNGKISTQSQGNALTDEERRQLILIINKSAVNSPLPAVP